MPSVGALTAFRADGSFEAEIGRLPAERSEEGSAISGIALEVDGL